jgi:hypothetical protein
MTWTRQQRHKAKAAKAKHEARLEHWLWQHGDLSVCRCPKCKPR